MKIDDFEMEVWMGLYEHHCAYNLAETCVKLLSLEELLELSGDREGLLAQLTGMTISYGEIEGSRELREQVASLYGKQRPENVVAMHGGISANSLVFLSLVEPGDEVIVFVPTYQQHYAIPKALGANVIKLPLRPENGFLPDVEELKAALSPRTKLVCISNPNNPTGTVMDGALLSQFVEAVSPYHSWILCDEVYRGLIHEGDSFGDSIADLYHRGISTGSMSKTFSLAGLRLGWVVGPEELIERVCRQRDYYLISVGILDDRLATVALKNREALLARNLELTRENAALLSRWVESEPRVDYVKPKGGTTAFVRFDAPLSSAEFCRRLQAEKGVMMLPGSALEMEGYVRIGYCSEYQVIREGLRLTSEFLDEVNGRG